MDQRLVGFVLLPRHLAEGGQHSGVDPDRDHLFRVAASRPSDAPCSLQFGIRRLGDVGKIDRTIGNRPDAPSGSPGAR